MAYFPWRLGLTIADALSRAPYSVPTERDEQFQQEVEVFVEQVISRLPATEHRLVQIRQKQEEDVICAEFCRNGWPTRTKCPSMLKPYNITVSSELSVKDGLLMRGNRIVIPAELQQDILHRLHEGHQGITKCRLRARESVWWLNLSCQIEHLIQKCPVCCKELVQRMEPLKSTELPRYPWNQVGMDLFQWEGRMYLIVIDYYSRYIAHHGIPECVISDNGPQFVSYQFKEFANKYDFMHHTSSPYHPQGNGEAERAVKTIKGLLKTSKDPYLALLTYRSTPLPGIGHSPAELLMSRRLRTTLPLTTNQLQLRVVQHFIISNRDKQYKQKQKENFDRRHGARPLNTLCQNDPVWMVDRKEEGFIKKGHI